MKATKFLFVMAMAAGLAACTKELVEPGKPVDSIEEVKGAKVIASGFSVCHAYMAGPAAPGRYGAHGAAGELCRAGAEQCAPGR